MRVLVFCSVLLHAAVCEEHCDSLDATGNTNFNEGNELLQVNADHGSSHDSVSSGVCSIEKGKCAKVTTSTSYNPKRAFNGQILKVGRKTAYNDCILVRVDGSGIENLKGMGFADSELEPAPCARKPNRMVQAKQANKLAAATSKSNRPQRAPVATAAEQAVSDATKQEERAARDAATAVAVSQDAVAAEARTVHDVAVTSQAAATAGPGHARARAWATQKAAAQYNTGAQKAAQKAAAQSKINEAGKDFIWGKQLPATGPGHARARAKAAKKAAAQSKINGAGKDFIWGKQLPATGPGHARARAKAAKKAAAQSKIKADQSKIKARSKQDQARAASTRAWGKSGA